MIGVSTSVYSSLMGTGFSPAALFSSSEPGLWLDPSDVADLAWRRNLLTFTEQFDNAAWLKNRILAFGSGSVVNAGTAPNGTTTADKVVPDTASGDHFISLVSPFAVAGQTYTHSVYAKASGYSFIRLSFGGSSFAFFNLTNGTVGQTGGDFTSISVQSVGDGWYRCSMTRTAVDVPNLNNSSIYIQSANSQFGWTGNGTDGVLLWGAQVELGSVATEYQRISDVNTEVVERFPTATMFQDTAGTTLVNSPGQTVALALDKSKGLVLGSELVTNGTFDADTDWTKGAGWTISGGVANKVGGTGRLSQLSASVVAGRTYQAQFTVVSVTVAGSGVGIDVGGTIFGSYTTAGTYTALLVAGASGVFAIQPRGDGSWAGSIDNISVKELPGNHATQATAASCPTYGVVPLGGRRNLLTWTENYSNAIWVKTNLNTSAGRITPTAVSGTHSATQDVADFTDRVLTVEAKADGYDLICIGSGISTGPSVTLNLSSGAIARTAGTGVLSSSAVLLSDGYYRFSVVISQASRYDFGMHVTQPGGTGDPSIVWTGDGTSGVLVRKPQHETGSTATAYQRVTTQYDVTEAGVQSLSYLSFDGVDDFLVTPTITPGVDKVQAFAGVRKLSDAASGILVELSANVIANTGSFYVVTGPDPTVSNRYSSSSRGSGGVFTSNAATTNTGDAPDQAVLSSTHDIAGDLTTIRRNGVAGTSSTADLGTGNFLAYPIYIGRRGAGSVPFNGQIYSMIVRFGSNLDAGTITSTETFVNEKTGAY
jgi:hypothetical protein